MITRIRTGAVDGIDGYPVTVEVDAGRGLPSFQIVGLPGGAVRESRERVASAVRNTGLKPPPGRVVVNLAPADRRKTGASFDLAIALGVVAVQEGEPAPPSRGGDAAFIGELSLCGELRPVRGLLSIVMALAQDGCRSCVVHRDQVREAAMVEGIEIFGATELAEVVRWYRTGEGLDRHLRDRDAEGRDECAPPPPLLLSAVGPTALRAAEVAAAGSLNLLLVGPPGVGKTRLARAVAALQPPPSGPAAVAITRIHSAAGLLAGSRPARRRPFRAPHHTVTRAGLVGGGPAMRPGEVTLAHGGVLFLDELAEFSPAVLDVLREPLEEGLITVAKGHGSRNWPADFQLVAAMNPCRCGWLGSVSRACTCTPAAVARYRGRLSGPLLDRIDMFVEVEQEAPPPLAPAAAGAGVGESEAAEWIALARGVAAARTRLAAASAAPQPGRPSLSECRRLLSPAAAALLEEARAGLSLSLRAVIRAVAVGRAIAALAGRDRLESGDVAEALRYRRERVPGLNAEAAPGGAAS